MKNDDKVKAHCKGHNTVSIGICYIGINKKGVPLFMTHPKHLFSVISKKLLLVDSEVDGYGDSYSSTYHRVVTHTEEAHHLYVSRN